LIPREEFQGTLPLREPFNPILDRKIKLSQNHWCHNLRFASPSTWSDEFASFQLDHVAGDRHLKNGGSILWDDPSVIVARNVHQS
jgi:hypothetical protein